MYNQTIPSVGFVEAFKLYFANYANFKGRARRSEYWKANLFLILFNMVGYALLLMLTALLGQAGLILTNIITFVWPLVTLVPSLSISFRRLHDIGKSGWWILCGLIPLVGSIVMLVFCCLDSTEDNRWGPNPKIAHRTYEAEGVTIPARRAPAPEPFIPEIPVPAVPAPEPFDLPAPETFASDWASSAVDFPVEPEPVPEMPSWNEPEGYSDVLPSPAAQPIPATEPVKEQTAGCVVVLSLCSGPMAGTSYRYGEGSDIILGRNPAKCDLVLSQYEAVSGVHCRITVCDQYITITDLKSTNGTYVNTVRLTPEQTVAAEHGSTIHLANADCAFQVCFE